MKISILDDLTHWGTIKLDSERDTLTYFGYEILKVDALLMQDGHISVQHNINPRSLAPENIHLYIIHYSENGRRIEKQLTSSRNHQFNNIKGINYGSNDYHEK